MKQLARSNNTKGTLKSPITQAVVAYLVEHGPSMESAIDRALVGISGYGPDAPPERLNRVMHKLRDAGHVCRVVKDGNKLWAPSPPPLPSKNVADADALTEVTAEPDDSVAPNLVPSPCFDLMRASAYVPDAGPALRPGALDFKRVQTFGLPC